MDASILVLKELPGGGSSGELHNRFKETVHVKYVWTPRKFSSIACTGCGRCNRGSIGHISKNEIFMELSKHSVNAG